MGSFYYSICHLMNKQQTQVNCHRKILINHVNLNVYDLMNECEPFSEPIAKRDTYVKNFMF